MWILVIGLRRGDYINIIIIFIIIIIIIIIVIHFFFGPFIPFDTSFVIPNMFWLVHSCTVRFGVKYHVS
jgi:hypothetical protein